MTRKIRLGLVGTSWWSDFFFSALKTHPGVELAAVCGRNKARADEQAAKNNIPAVFTDYAEMMRAGGLEAVVVVTPDDTHHAITLAALDAGLHVLCEKPLAVTAQQAREMLERAEAKGLRHMVHFTYRWMPYFRYFHDLVAEGFVGRLYHAEFSYLGGWARDTSYAWRYDQDRANGVLGDLGSHWIDMAHWLAGPISRVRSHLGVYVKRDGAQGGPLANPANESSLLLVEFANGAHGTIHASSVAHIADRGMQQQVKLYGEAGTLEINANYGGPEDGAVIRAVRAGENEFKTLPVPDSYWAGAQSAAVWDVFNTQSVGVRAFVDSILEDRPATPDFRDGYRAQQVIDAALASHRIGEAVSIPSE
jgi:predicted dehydrogenase